MISSTLIDLPDHRKAVEEACLRRGMFPLMMEHLPACASDATGISLSLVEQADIYLGVFAHRYGYVPEGQDKSIVEMEYERAVERGIPRLIFVMHEDHLLTIKSVEMGAGAIKLRAFKERLLKENVGNFFKDPADLRGSVLNSLVPYGESQPNHFHYVTDIPAPPEPYIAHTYSLLRTKALVGRQHELNMLTDWVTNRNTDAYPAHLLIITAIAGMGKSALTWRWFNEVAPYEMRPLAGRMWWSFYESDAYFENFVTRALAYVTRRAKEEVGLIPQPEREEQLLSVLNRKPYLLVLDGLERILTGYTLIDSAHLTDDELDEHATNEEHRLRKTADPRAGDFLRKLASVRSSRILISSRLFPAELDTPSGQPYPGSFNFALKGLSDDDAINLWREFGVSGSRELLLPMFHLFENHPLLIRALASEVGSYRPAPGDFDRWRKAHPDFDPFGLPLKQVKTHVLEFPLRGLDGRGRRLLHIVAALRMPATYPTLESLLVGDDKLLPDAVTLDAVLTELEDRGLLSWDRIPNRYALHPFVRGVIWSQLAKHERREVCQTLYDYFSSLDLVRSWQKKDWKKVTVLEDLTAFIELYNTLICLEQYEDAGKLFIARLERPLYRRLSANRQRAELMERLFPDGLFPRLEGVGKKAFFLAALALAYSADGQPGRAVPLYVRELTLLKIENKPINISIALYKASDALRQVGRLCGSEDSARQALKIAREHDDRFHEAVILEFLALALAARGEEGESETALSHSLQQFTELGLGKLGGAPNSFLAQRALWLGDFAAARLFANRARQLVDEWPHELALIRAVRLQGLAALGLGELDDADTLLHGAIGRARVVNLVEEELPALVGLAELMRRQGRHKAARELLQDVRELAERGPYPLFYADAYNVLAQLELDAGRGAEAAQAASKAFRLSWCDGPPYIYARGLRVARAHLTALSAQEPDDLSPFDKGRCEVIKIGP